MDTTEAVDNKAQNTDEYRTLCDPQLFLEDHFGFLDPQNRGIIDARGRIKGNRSAISIRDEAFLCYIKRCKEYHAAEKLKPIEERQRFHPANADEFNKHFNLYVETVGSEKKEYFKDTVTHDATLRLAEVDKVLECLNVSVTEKHRLIFAHWMWLVKRSIYHPGTPKDHPFMLLLIGSQGLGKTWAVNRFVGPIKPFVFQSNPRQITDDRYQFSMCDNFIVVLEEMAKIEKTSMEALKQIVTAETLDIRVLGSNRVQEIINNSTFIGSSNKTLTEMIYDPTGLRRFVEIDMSRPTNRELLKVTDFTTVWRAIDENLKGGYIEPVLVQVREDQERSRETDTIDDFVEHYKLNGGTGKVEIRSCDLYVLYKNWCQDNHYTWLDHKPWGRKLVAAKVPRLRREMGTRYAINAESSILKNVEPDGSLRNPHNLHHLMGGRNATS